MQNEPRTTEEQTQEGESLQKTLAETVNRLRKEKTSKTFWKYLSIVLICVFLYQKQSNVVWLPVADSQQMCAVVSDWWGLKVQAFYPVWRKPTGDNREYSEQWCIKYPDDSWRVFYSGHGKSPNYTYPLVTYSTYF